MAGEPSVTVAKPERLERLERRVAVLTGEGFTSREIGRRLSMAPRTVDGYRSVVMRKLGLEHRAELVRLLLRAGLLGADGSRLPPSPGV